MAHGVVRAARSGGGFRAARIKVHFLRASRVTDVAQGATACIHSVSPLGETRARR